MATEPPAPPPAIIPLGDATVAAARKVKRVHVGALDAIHIASALALKERLAGVATYDKRMQDALLALGVRVIAPEEIVQEDPSDGPTPPAGAGRQTH